MDKIKLGVIGIGNMGRCHILNLNEGHCPEVELTAVADFDAEKIKWCDENCPDAKQFSDAKEMIDSGLCDSILVAVPHYDHCDLSQYALEKDINVLCEKPIGVYTKQVRPVIEAAKNSKGVFALMYNQRTDPLYIKVKDLVSSGEMGELVRMNWIVTNWYRPQAYYNQGEWRATWAGEGGGVLMNQAPHNIDLWQWICGMPKSIQARLKYGLRHEIEVEDEVIANASYENGATATFITSTGEYPGSNRLEITLDGGKLVCEDGKLEITRITPFESKFTKENEFTFKRPEITKEVFEPENSGPQHWGVINAFAANILHGENLIARGEEGIKGLTLSNAMHLSSFLGGKEIELPFDEDQYYALLQEKVKTSKKLSTKKAITADHWVSFI